MHFYTAIGTAPVTINNSANRIQIHAECRRKKTIGGVSGYDEYDEYERSYGIGFDDEMF